MFNQQSEEYLRQIEAEIERLQQLRDQVQTTIHGEETLSEAESQAPRKRAVKKSAGTKAAETAVAKKRGRPKSNPA